MQNFLGNRSLRLATVPAVARFYCCRGPHTRLGNRRDHRNVYLDPRGDAPLVARF